VSANIHKVKNIHLLHPLNKRNPANNALGSMMWVPRVVGGACVNIPLIKGITMKTFLSILLAVAICACDEANVLSDDNKELQHCNGFNWIECVHNICPNGYMIIRQFDNQVLKCKPACNNEK
jgi:hypothetical protein